MSTPPCGGGKHLYYSNVKARGLNTFGPKQPQGKPFTKLAAADEWMEQSVDGALG